MKSIRIKVTGVLASISLLFAGCGALSKEDIDAFSLRIERSAHKTLYFRVYSEEGVFCLETTVSVGEFPIPPGKKRGETIRNSRRTLTEAERDEIRLIFAKMEFPSTAVSSDYSIRDGSEWMLRIKGALFDRTFSCSTPMHHTSQRHLDGVLALGRSLWKMAAIDEPERNFY